MTMEPALSPVEQSRRALGRAGYLAAMAGLVVGVAAFIAHQWAIAQWTLILTMGVLVCLPVINVVAILAEEIRKRDWWFAFVAIAVLVLLAFNVVRRLFS